eukprot:5120417-Prymnesium_polylepis.1
MGTPRLIEAHSGPAAPQSAHVAPLACSARNGAPSVLERGLWSSSGSSDPAILGEGGLPY